MDKRALITSGCAYQDWKIRLREIAQKLIWQCGFSSPPYDPLVFAKKMGVNVDIEPIAGLDGYIEHSNGNYFAVISSLANHHRQRFTICHELGHVIFMKQAAIGNPVPLVRYRATGCPPGLHQDPIEESLCNIFASELLLPSGEVRDRVLSSGDPLNCILELSKAFDVSMQAAARRLVTIIGKKRIGCALWKNREGKLWPMPVWSEGLTTNCRSHLDQLEDLVARSARTKDDLSVTFDCVGTARSKAHVQVRALGRSYSLVLVADSEQYKKVRAAQGHFFPRSTQGKLF